MDTAIKQEVPDSEAIKLFYELKGYLPYSSTRKIVSLVRTILSRIRSRSSSQSLAGITPETSSIFHLLSVCYQCNGEEKKETIHLDELVDDLYMEDQNRIASKQLFKSEVDALSIITTVLRKIGELFNASGITAFNYTLTHEIQQASEEGLV
ncbi:MAG TPA: hypothetical protein VIM65_23530 [Cyclobacteriaceae bacterium]